MHLRSLISNIVVRSLDSILPIKLSRLAIEALPGSTCSLVPLKISSISLVPQNKNLDFLCSLFPKIAFSLFPSVLEFCSLVPRNKCPYSPVPQNPWEGLANPALRLLASLWLNGLVLLG